MLFGREFLFFAIKLQKNDEITLTRHITSFDRKKIMVITLEINK